MLLPKWKNWIKLSQNQWTPSTGNNACPGNTPTDIFLNSNNRQLSLDLAVPKMFPRCPTRSLRICREALLHSFLVSVPVTVIATLHICLGRAWDTPGLPHPRQWAHCCAVRPTLAVGHCSDSCVWEDPSRGHCWYHNDSVTNLCPTYLSARMLCWPECPCRQWMTRVCSVCLRAGHTFPLNEVIWGTT